MRILQRNTTRVVATAAFALLAGCAQMNPQPAPPAPVAYNPPAAAVAAMPTADATHYRIGFASGSSQIDSAGMATVASVADLIQANAALTATLVGTADALGSDASNMALSKKRSIVVHNALLRTGKVAEARLDTRWVGERQPDATPELAVRSVEIILH